jgi:citrate synthase
LPSSSELKSFKDRLVSSSSLPGHVIESMKLWPRNTETMQVLMAVISILGFDDHDPYNNSPEAYEEKAVRLLPAMAVAMTAWERIRQGLDPVSYSEGLSHAENILFMMKGEKPDPEIARALDICLILHADHTFNASTFACREVASTQAGIYPAVLAGLAALSGPLHGGANEKAMAMIEGLRNEDDIESWIQKQISEKKKIYGMGHAVYKTYDPRAAILKDIFKKIGATMGDSAWYTLCEKVITLWDSLTICSPPSSRFQGFPDGVHISLKNGLALHSQDPHYTGLPPSISVITVGSWDVITDKKINNI